MAEVKLHTQAKLRVNDTNPNDDDNEDEIIPFIGDQLVMPDDGDDPLSPDEIGIYTLFFEGEGNPSDLEGIDNAQLRLIQTDL